MIVQEDVMKKNRKMIALVLSLLMVMSVVSGCGRGSLSSSAQTNGGSGAEGAAEDLSLIHISEPTRP